jgi:hypothetical protein
MVISNSHKEMTNKDSMTLLTSSFVSISQELLQEERVLVQEELELVVKVTMYIIQVSLTLVFIINSITHMELHLTFKTRLPKT